MDEILSKRIILLTNAIIVLSCLGFLALIHRVDASYKEKEYIALNRLHNCIELIPQNAGLPEASALPAKIWLEQHNPKVYAQNHLLADSLVSQLAKAGFEDDIRAIKMDAPRRISDFQLLRVRGTDTVNCCELGFGNLTGNNRLYFFIQQYRHLLSGTEIVVSTGLRDEALQAAISKSHALNPGKKSSDNFSGDKPRAAIESIQLVGDSLRIDFQLTSSFYQETGGETIMVPLETTVVPGPTWMDLYGIDPDFKELAKAVELQKIATHYGELPMDKVIEMIGDDYMQAFENVDIFGFSFSTTSLPLALLAFFTFLSVALYLMVREAGKRQLKVFSGFDNEEITDYFVKRPFIRTILWLVLPLASLTATLPVLPVESEKLIVLGAGSIILLTVNLITLMKARSL